MRRWFAAACIAIPVGLAALAGCASPDTSTGSSAPARPVATSDAPPVVSAAPASKVNPCKLVTGDDLGKIFKATSVEQVTADDTDPNNPPVTGSFNERNCGYIVSVPGIYGDNPNDDTGTQLSIMVTTHEDNAAGEQWKATKQGGQLAAQGEADISRTEYRPVTNIGDEAFFAGPGWLMAHKGDVIIEVNSADDTDGILDDTQAAAVVLRAFTRVH
jgi:hypothetical protein